MDPKGPTTERVYPTGTSRFKTFKGSQQIRWKAIKIFCDFNLSLPKAKRTRFFTAVIGREPGYRLSGLGDENLLSVSRPGDEPGELGLGIMDVDDSFHI
jgi:hypothetical protein